MNGMLGRRFGSGFAAAVLLALCIAVTASAAAPTVATRTKTATENDQTLVEAKCPKGKAPVSGGFEFAFIDSFAVNSLEGVDLDRKRWSVNTISVLGPTRVTSFAYCSKLGRNVEFRSDRTDLEQGESATLTATCKRDERVLSGGYAFVSSGLSAAEVTQSFREDARSWTIKAILLSDNPTTFLAFAHCQAKQKVPKLTPEKQTVRFQDEGDTTATATCGNNRYALSGGFKIPGDLPETPSLSHRVGTRGWKATTGGIKGRDDNFTALAYCAKK